MNLFICEKATEAEAVAHGLGNNPIKKDGYWEIGDNWVAWLYGHILKLYMPPEYDDKYKKFCHENLPIIPVVWKKKVGDLKVYRSALETVRKLLPKSDVVINAGDADREGQLLVDEVLEYVGYSGPCKRAKFDALDPASIQRALQKIEDNNAPNNRNMYQAGLARQRLDWLIGMNASMKFSLDAQAKLGIGRVKVPTIALVVRRNRQIDNFVSVKHYGLEAYFRTQTALPFKTVWKMKDDQEGLDENNRLIDVTVARALQQKLEGKSGTVLEVKTKQEHQAAPLPFSLSRLQRTAGPKLGLTPAQVLDLAQKLYEKKLTSYPRAGCTYLPESQFGDAPMIIENLKVAGNERLLALAARACPDLKSIAFNDQKIEAHHAIIPTMTKFDITTLPADEQKLYIMIAERYLLQFYPEYVYDKTTVTINCCDETFIGIGRNVIEYGWKAASASEDTPSEQSDEESENQGKLPALSEGDNLLVSKVNIPEKNTAPPARFVQDTLLGAMVDAYKYVKDPSLKSILKETDGLGTEATRGSIIEQLFKSGMLEERTKNKKKEIYASAAAEELIDFLPEELTYPDKSALMELELKQIASGEISLQDYMEKQHRYVHELIKLEANFINKGSVSFECPLCKEGKLFKRKSKDKNGKERVFWGCSRWKEGCKAIFDDHKDAPAIYKCPKCGPGYLRKRSGTYGTFYSCNNYPDCTASYPDAKGKPDLIGKTKKPGTTSKSSTGGNKVRIGKKQAT